MKLLEGTNLLLQISSKNYETSYDTTHRPKHATTQSRKLIKYRSDTIRGPGILGDWRLQAELVARRLLAYTPTPSNPSFMGAFVP